MARPGAEYFSQPTHGAQRRYEALRAYLLDALPAKEVGDRFGYRPETIHVMAAQLRAGDLDFFLSSKPGPKGPRKQPAIRARVLELRAEDLPVTEIAAVVSAEGTPVSHQTVFEILRAEGLERLPTRARGPAPRLSPVKARPLKSWPAGTSIDSAYAGLYLLVPTVSELELPRVIATCGYPRTSVLSAWHSLGALLILKLLRGRRAGHATDLGSDLALGLWLGLTAIPKTTSITRYSYKVRRSSNEALQRKLVAKLRALGLASGEQGFNLDFHAIRHHGSEVPLEANYVPKRSQATRSVLTFFAQDHASTEMVYANADVSKATQATEVVAFADYWKKVTRADPGLLVFDSKLTTYQVLNELSARGITWLTLRMRGKAVLAELAKVPESAWKKPRIERAGRYRTPHLFEQTISIKGIDRRVRQIAIKNIGRDEATLLITNDETTPAAQLFARYAHRMLIENNLAAYITGFHLDALSSGLPLNVDVDTTMTVVAGNIYRLFAEGLARYENTLPDTLFRHFVDTAGKIMVEDDHVTVRLNARTYAPVLIEAGYADREVLIPWWNKRKLRFEFS